MGLRVEWIMHNYKISHFVTLGSTFLSDNSILKDLCTRVPHLLEGGRERPLKFFIWPWYITMTKLSSSGYNGWKVEISGMKDFRAKKAPPARPLKVGVIPRNLPLLLMCYHAKFGGSATLLPVELSTKHYALC